ncbi:tyrosine-type recombinase/integrase [Pseudoduganella sp. UC29_106]|uniref:tyrosine-type recombinase/integrase n=1 Tax=Pseudoduganella sp. UC29_106 TaxID=3374553 RepID=UPI0037566D3F
MIWLQHCGTTSAWNGHSVNECSNNAIVAKRPGSFLSTDGQEYSARYLNNAFASNSKKTGVVCRPHMLRHTYGTYEFLRVVNKYSQSQALLWVRDRMGHTSITTTEKYLHTAAILKNDDIDLYQSELLGAFSKWP